MDKKLCCLFLFLSCIYIKAQVVLPKSLEDAVNSAIEKSINLKNGALDLEKIRLEEQSVLSLFVPKIEANAIYAYFDNNLEVDLETATLPVSGLQLFNGTTDFSARGNFFQTGIISKTVLFSGGQIRNSAKALSQKAEGNLLLLEVEKDKIVQEVLHSFDQLFLINASEILIDDTEKRLKTENDRVEKAIENGLAVPYDRDKIKLARLELQSKKVELAGTKNLLYQKIRYLTNYDQTDIENVIYELQPYILLDKLQSIDNKKELKALESFKGAYEYLLKKEKGKYLPTVGAFAGLSYLNTFNTNISFPLPTLNNNLNAPINQFTLFPNWIFGAALKWELFSGFERKHKIKEAEINIIQTQNKLDDTKQKLELQLTQKIAAYEVLLQRIILAEEQEKVAANNLNLATKQYREGLISISERLVAENDLLKARQNKVKIVIDQRFAAVDVIMASGAMHELLLNKVND